MKNLIVSRISKLFLSFAMVLAFSVSSFAMTPRQMEGVQIHNRQHVTNICKCSCGNNREYKHRNMKKYHRMVKQPRPTEIQNGIGLIFVFVSNI